MTAVATRLFTVSQWQELEQQALIFKYLMAGVPVPLNLMLPIQKSFESVPSRIFHNPTMYGGKKIDPEPDRCRRSDGKKWRCSKDAFPDSKYCEHHMNRGRNRSRKPVESSSSQNMPSANADHHSTFRSKLPLLSFPNNSQETGTTRFNLDPISSAYGNNIHKDYSNIDGYKVGEHSFFGMEKGDEMGLGLESPQPWSVNPIFSAGSNSQNPSEEEERYEGQSLRPFFDELPGTRGPWCGLGEEDGSFSRTRLSMSIPMASSSIRKTEAQPRGF